MASISRVYHRQSVTDSETESQGSSSSNSSSPASKPFKDEDDADLDSTLKNKGSYRDGKGSSCSNSSSPASKPFKDEDDADLDSTLKNKESVEDGKVLLELTEKSTMDKNELSHLESSRQGSPTLLTSTPPSPVSKQDEDDKRQEKQQLLNSERRQSTDSDNNRDCKDILKIRKIINMDRKLSADSRRGAPTLLTSTTPSPVSKQCKDEVLPFILKSKGSMKDDKGQEGRKLLSWEGKSTDSRGRSTRSISTSPSPSYTQFKKGDHVGLELTLKTRCMKEDQSLWRLITEESNTPNYSKCLDVVCRSLRDGRTVDHIDMQDADGRTLLHHAVINQNEECIQGLLSHGARIDTKDCYGQNQVHNMTEKTLRSYLDSRITTNDKSPSDADYEIYLDYGSILRKKDRGRVRKGRWDDEYEFPMDLLQEVKRRPELTNLISHPMFSYILFIKWQLLRKLYWFLVISYSLFCGVFTASTILWTHHVGVTEDEAPWSVLLVHCIALALLLFNFIIELCFLLGNVKKYIKSLDHVLKVITLTVCCVTLVLPFFFPFGRDCVEKGFENVYIHFRGISILICWFELFFVTHKFPALTSYAKLFRTTFLQLLEFLLIHSPIIIGFVLSFFVLFSKRTVLETGGAQEADEINPFATPWHSFFKTFVMFTGEYEIDRGLFEIAPGTSHFVFIMFIACIIISLMNLLIGLASNATKDVKRNPFKHGCGYQIFIIQRFEHAFLSVSEDSLTLRVIRAVFFCGLFPISTCTHRQNQELTPANPKNSKVILKVVQPRRKGSQHTLEAAETPRKTSKTAFFVKESIQFCYSKALGVVMYRGQTNNLYVERNFQKSLQDILSTKKQETTQDKTNDWTTLMGEIEKITKYLGMNEQNDKGGAVGDRTNTTLAREIADIKTFLGMGDAGNSTLLSLIRSAIKKDSCHLQAGGE